jgi:hypothetical protein
MSAVAKDQHRGSGPLKLTDQYISRKRLAVELGRRLRGKAFSERTLIAWEHDRRGPPVTRVGRDVFYYIPSVEAWLRQQEGK